MWRRTGLQLVAAFAAIFGGAWLIGLWAVGVVLVLAGLAGVADAVLSNRDQWQPVRDLPTHGDVLERWRRAP